MAGDPPRKELSDGKEKKLLQKEKHEKKDIQK